MQDNQTLEIIRLSNDDKQYIELMLERAAKKGAVEALKLVGLSDDNAPEDIRDLRNLLDSFKAAKRTILNTVVTAFTWLFLGALAAGALFKLNSGKFFDGQ